MTGELARALQWAADVIHAADEAGYGVVAMAPGRVELTPYASPSTSVVIDSVFVSGALIGLTLRPLDEETP